MQAPRIHYKHLYTTFHAVIRFVCVGTQTYCSFFGSFNILIIIIIILGVTNFKNASPPRVFMLKFCMQTHKVPFQALQDGKTFISESSTLHCTRALIGQKLKKFISRLIMKISTCSFFCSVAIIKALFMIFSRSR